MTAFVKDPARSSPLSLVASTFERETSIGKAPPSVSRAAKLSFVGAASRADGAQSARQAKRRAIAQASLITIWFERPL
jgi:hypothetical protein